MKWQRVMRMEDLRKGLVGEFGIDELLVEPLRRVVEWSRKEGRRAVQSVLEKEQDAPKSGAVVLLAPLPLRLT
jgi:hypothetical protein